MLLVDLLLQHTVEKVRVGELDVQELANIAYGAACSVEGKLVSNPRVLQQIEFPDTTYAQGSVWSYYDRTHSTSVWVDQMRIPLYPSISSSLLSTVRGYTRAKP